MPTNVPENPSPSNAGLTKMRLTTLTDYALRVLIYTGAHSERLCTISEIAKAFDISQAHLMKVSQLLAQLSKSPQEIPLGAVVRSIEPDFNLVECLGPNNHCRLTGGCALTCILNGALKAFWQHLDCYTLADVIARPGLPVLAQSNQPIAISR